MLPGENGGTLPTNSITAVDVLVTRSFDARTSVVVPFETVSARKDGPHMPVVLTLALNVALTVVVLNGATCINLLLDNEALITKLGRERSSPTVELVITPATLTLPLKGTETFAVKSTENAPAPTKKEESANKNVPYSTKALLNDNLFN